MAKKILLADDSITIQKVVELTFGCRPCGRTGDPQTIQIDIDAFTDLADHRLVRRILLAPAVPLCP